MSPTKTAKKSAPKKATTKKKKPAAKPAVAEEHAHVSRPAWQGAISFGLIHFPVKLFGVSTNRRIAFHQLHGEDGARIKQKRFCSKEDVEVPYDEIVRGYDLGGGRHVVIEPAEFDEIAPARSKVIELEKFIDAEQIDPLYYDASYFVLPGKDAERPYALLREAMLAEDRAAVAQFVMRGKEHLVSLWPRSDVLVLSTMHFSDEITDPAKFDAGDPPKKAHKQAELKTARQLISALSEDFDVTEYRDEYREKVLELIDAKAKGKKIAVEPDIRDRTPAKDLMAALEESLASLSDVKPRSRKRGSKGAHKTSRSH